MDRDEFMELVYETFADEPDNVLANGIIEAADAYVEYEKAQLSCEGTTSDTISKTETVEHLRRVLEATVPNTDYDEGYIDGVEFGISTVSTMPIVQPEPKKGKWSDGYRWQRCSLCKQTGKKSWNYCPYCGADMRGENDG